MTTITDEYMRQMISQTRQYRIVILKAGGSQVLTVCLMARHEICYDIRCLAV